MIFFCSIKSQSYNKVCFEYMYGISMNYKNNHLGKAQHNFGIIYTEKKILFEKYHSVR